MAPGTSLTATNDAVHRSHAPTDAPNWKDQPPRESLTEVQWPNKAKSAGTPLFPLGER
jgi:hypothetical protein